jgi:hypothetical protein
VHDVVFDLIDELVDVCESDAFHAGMDEVFLLGEDDCPRCKGKDKAQLFADEVRRIHDHLAQSNRTMWMWGDRFLDGETTGIGKWEASMNQTAPAIKLVPKDIVICDWHYELTLPTAEHFAIEGFQVLPSPWRKPDVALNQLAAVRNVRMRANPVIAGRMAGVLQTTWCGFAQFAHAYFGEPAETPAREAAICFRTLFREIRATEAQAE